MAVSGDRFGDLLEWGGDAVVFDYESRMGRTFGVTGRVIERSGNELRFEAKTETGPGIDEAEANWTGRLVIQDSGIRVWAEARFTGNDDHLKGTVSK